MNVGTRQGRGTPKKKGFEFLCKYMTGRTVSDEIKSDGC